MAGKNDNFDALMAMMALKHIMDDFFHFSYISAKVGESEYFICSGTTAPLDLFMMWIILI